MHVKPGFSISLESMWIYIVGPLVGGTMAGLFNTMNTKAIASAKEKAKCLYTINNYKIHVYKITPYANEHIKVKWCHDKSQYSN